MGTHYPLKWEDRIRNYMIAHDELDIDNSEMIEHFKSHIGEAATTSIVQKIEDEINNPFYFFDAIYCINKDSEHGRWQQAKNQLDKLGIGHRVQRFSAIETPQNHHIGCALSHRTIIQNAVTNQYKNVLVLEDDVIFDTKTLSHLTNSIKEARAVKWDILFLGACTWDLKYSLVQDCQYLREVPDRQRGPTTAHALVYNASSYSTILEELPDNVDAMAQYVELNHLAIDQYFSVAPLKRMIIEPRVATQIELLVRESDDFTPMTSLE